MLVVISPAKNLEFERPLPIKKHTKAALLDRSESLIATLKTMAPHELSHLMGISDKLGELNYQRYQDWSLPFKPSNARASALAFNGDVYAGLDAYSFTSDDFVFAQNHLRILSGLYGLLRPLDLIQPYRLEMGTKLSNSEGENLYAYWRQSITALLNKQLNNVDHPVLVNLASNEYFKAVDTKALKARVITPVFKEYKNGDYKVVSFFAKKARGLMSRYIIQRRLEDSKNLTKFNLEGYKYSREHSNDSTLTFLRDGHD